MNRRWPPAKNIWTIVSKAHVHSKATVAPHNTLNNYAANNLIKKLHQSEIKKAFKIYGQINETKNHFVINTMLKFCFDSGYYSKATIIWTDIELLHKTNNSDKHKILYYVLIKCFVKSEKTNISQIINILRHIKECDYKLKLTTPFIIGLLHKSVDNLPSLEYIHSLIDDGYIGDINDSENIICKTELINIYGRIGEIESALGVFESIRHKTTDVICFSAIMSALLKNEYYRKTFSLYDEICARIDNEVIHCLAINACIKLNDFDRGKRIHSNYGRNEHYISLKNKLIEFYGQFGDHRSSLDVFDSISDDKKQSAPINAMIKCLIHNDENKLALSIYDRCINQTDAISHVYALKACKNMNDFEYGQRIIDSVANKQSVHSIETLTTLIDFYGHFGHISDALNVYESIDENQRGTVTVNAMLKCFANNGKYEECINLYQRSESKHDDASHVIAIRACQLSKNYKLGIKLIESSIDLKEMKNRNIELINILIDFFGDSNQIEIALDLFEGVPESKKDPKTIGSIVNALINNKYFDDALIIYDKYKDSLCDEITHVLALKACENTNNLEKGRKIIESNANYKNIEMMTSVIHFYGAFGQIEDALSAFSNTPIQMKNSAAINTMMSCLINDDQFERALKIYDEYSSLNTDVSHNLALKACKNINDFDRGRQIISEGIVNAKHHSVEVLTSLVDFYAHAKDVEAAQSLFDGMNAQMMTIETINAMLNGYYINELNSKCIELFESIDTVYNLEANVVSYSILFKACAQSTLLHVGQCVHDELERTESNKWMLSQTTIQTNLINMYGECGELQICEDLMDKIKVSEPRKYLKEIRIWNSMNNAYGKNGQMNKVKDVFVRMKAEGLVPNNWTYTIMISNYGHFGMIEDAKDIWNNLSKNEELKNDKLIVAASIDCLSRNGHLDDAYDLIVEYEDICDEAMWISLLGGCRKFDNKQMAQIVFYEFAKRFRNNNHYMSSARKLFAHFQRK